MNGIVAKSMMWNLWHGCHKLSAGCKHCYVYRGDARREVDSSVVVRTKNFDLPLRKKRNGEFKIPPAGGRQPVRVDGRLAPGDDDS